MSLLKTLEDFKENIGKRVYRNAVDCCGTCSQINENGLIVHDEMHADYLANLQVDFLQEGIDLQYRTEK